MVAQPLIQCFASTEQCVTLELAEKRYVADTVRRRTEYSTLLENVGV